MSVKLFSNAELPLDSAFNTFRDNPPDLCLRAGQSHCGLWFTHSGAGTEPYGVIGHYSAADRGQSLDLLTEACRILRDKGCAAAYGPMDGSTWKSYRFVTWSDGSPPFFMEPQQPPEWPLYWQEAGFVPCHEYISTLVTDLDFSDPRLAKARLRLQQAGISLRPVNLERFEDELKDVYQLSLEAFKKNILYTPIDLAAFLRQYLPLAESIDRHFMLLARDKTDLCCGFVFAIPDLLQRQQGMVPERVIIKTLAVHPGRQYAGLGAVLVDAIQQRARTHGFGAAIHALMHAGNVSTNIGKNSRIIRRYTLFSKTLV